MGLMKARGLRKGKALWDRIGIPTWNLVTEAILTQDTQHAITLLYNLREEWKAHHDFLSDWWAGMITYVGSNFGEEEVERMWRYIFSDVIPNSCNSIELEGTKEYVYALAETWRAHYADEGEINVSEEDDRYILSVTCGTGGRMIREGKLKPPYNFGVTSKPYSWSWGKVGVPWYCVHCALCWGIMAIEATGYPLRVHELPENFGDPCRIIVYKDPKLVPSKYFAELGEEHGQTSKIDNSREKY